MQREVKEEMGDMEEMVEMVEEEVVVVGVDGEREVRM